MEIPLLKPCFLRGCILCGIRLFESMEDLDRSPVGSRDKNCRMSPQMQRCWRGYLGRLRLWGWLKFSYVRIGSTPGMIWIVVSCVILDDLESWYSGHIFIITWINYCLNYWLNTWDPMKIWSATSMNRVILEGSLDLIRWETEYERLWARESAAVMIQRTRIQRWTLMVVSNIDRAPFFEYPEIS